ncbi:hypothetical protein AMJ80_05370 [bacterium SM23_31]|nr:MAG: hypothetical protein AMJ80_05370 [bacterium SM23_31]
MKVFCGIVTQYNTKYITNARKNLYKNNIQSIVSPFSFITYNIFPHISYILIYISKSSIKFKNITEYGKLFVKF